LWFREKLKYLKIDYNSDYFCEKCLFYLDKDEINYFYIALPPKVYEKTLILLGKLKEKGFKIRILIEKPFGENFGSAERLVSIIKKYDLNKEIFLADHYLFKENIPVKKIDFKKINLISTEKIGLEGRVTFYDDVGALKDMVQSHLLSMLFMIILDINLLKDFKVKKYIKGQYGDGFSNGYVKELGKKSDTETFVYLSIIVKNKVINLISGKGLEKKQTKIEIDGEEILIEDKGSYAQMLKDFSLDKKEKFPSMENALFSWKIIEEILKTKASLVYYKKGSCFNEIVKNG